MEGSYDLTLVFASYCVAVIASYTALYFGSRLFDISGPSRKLWLGFGAVCMGSGIWSMHFVGMSAYTMPMGMEMSFNLPLTALSWVPAVVASALALYVITRERAPARSIVASAMIMGAGICAMHYGGMYAMRMDPPIQYDPMLFGLSVLIAVVASGAALVICRQVRRVPAGYVFLTKTVAALVMGLAICGMHYTGMAAAIYVPGSVAAGDNLLRGDWMGIPTAVAAGVFLLVALGIALHDFRTLEMEKRQRQERAEWVSEAAQKDKLTGFFNRHHFESLLGKKIAGRGAVEPFTLVSVELDLYRELVKRKGEKAAAGMVRAVAAALIRCLPNSVYSRSSSGRFLVVTRALEQQEILSVINELKDRLTVSEDAREYGNFSLGHAHYPSSASSSRMLIDMARRRRQAVDLSRDNAPA